MLLRMHLFFIFFYFLTICYSWRTNCPWSEQRRELEISSVRIVSLIIWKVSEALTDILVRDCS